MRTHGASGQQTLSNTQRAACSVTARVSRCHNLWQWRRIVQCGAPKWRHYREHHMHFLK